MDIDTKACKEEFLNLLRSTKRYGVEDLVESLEEMDFFNAPASAGHHLNQDGGLALHSLNVCKSALSIWNAMKELKPEIGESVTKDNVIIASLLHDICKSDIYKPTVKHRKNNFGVWEDYKGYKVSYKNFPMGHGEKSVIVALCSGIELSDDEMLAIRWHMGPWGLNMNSYEDERCYDTAQKLYPLVSIIHAADCLAANILEITDEDLEEV